MGRKFVPYGRHFGGALTVVVGVLALATTTSDDKKCSVRASFQSHWLPIVRGNEGGRRKKNVSAPSKSADASAGGGAKLEGAPLVSLTTPSIGRQAKKAELGDDDNDGKLRRHNQRRRVAMSGGGGANRQIRGFLPDEWRPPIAAITSDGGSGSDGDNERLATAGRESQSVSAVGGKTRRRRTATTRRSRAEQASDTPVAPVVASAGRCCDAHARALVSTRRRHRNYSVSRSTWLVVDVSARKRSRVNERRL